MKITLYKTNSNPKAITKTLTDSLVFDDCNSIRSLDVLHPDIVLSGTDLEKYNYAYIDDLNRYYFIKPEITASGMYDLHAKCDVLMSHDAAIRLQSGILSRSETMFNTYLSDAAFNSLCYRRVQTILFSTDPFSTSGNGYYLVANGGSSGSNT